MGRAQMPFPAYELPYIQNEVTSIRITLPADSALAMLANQSDSHFYEAQFIFESSGLNDTIINAGISLRGNTSLNSFKKSFKISFNEFDNGGSWQDVDQINLIGQQNDPSMLRSALCHSMYRFMEVAAPRTSFTRLYLNETYMGLYLNQEHIDEEFTKKYFDDQGDGNLYKCTYPADLDYISDDPDDYKFANWGTRHYELKTNEWKDDYSDLAHFIDVLNNTDLEDMECALPEVLDVDGFLRAAAVEVLIGHWDSYIYNMNNYYLYNNQLTGQFQFIPYDMDNTLGIDWVGQDWVDRNIYSFAPSGDPRPLYKRLMQIETYRNRFSEHIDYLLDNFFNQDVMIAQAYVWQELIEEAALEDEFRTLDFGFDDNAFLNAIDQAWGEPQVDYGIADFVVFRSNNVSLELDDISTTQAQVSWIIQPILMSETSDFIRFEARITGEQSNQCTLEVSTDNTNFTVLNGLNDAGLNGDLIAGDHIYSIETNQAFTGDKLYYRIAMPGGNQYPCSSEMCWITPLTTGLHINEVMSKNNFTASYNGLNYPDWLELWNSNANSTNLFNWCLTDDIYNWNKFQFESVAFAAGEYKMIWLDNDPEIGPEHTTFQLSGNDSAVWLLTVQLGSPRIVNVFYPCEAPDDISQERITDGSNTISLTSQPTPGSSNNPVSTSELTSIGLAVYPNPASDEVTLTKRCTKVIIRDVQGKILIDHANVQSISVNALSEGIYFIEADGTVLRLALVK